MSQENVAVAREVLGTLGRRDAALLISLADPEKLRRGKRVWLWAFRASEAVGLRE